MLFAALYFPSLALDVVARSQSPESRARSFVVDSGGHVPRIVAANGAARTAGLRDGMLLSAAYALAPELVRQPRDPAGEEAALAGLATLALTFTPSVALALPDAITAEIGSSLRLFGGRDRLVDALKQALVETGFEARLGLAPTPLAALALARAGRSGAIETPAALESALAPLALAHFALPEEARVTLAAAGVTTFGEAERLPRAGLARRFGPALVRTLDRALGRVPDPRAAYVPPPRFAARLELPAAVDEVEALAFAVHRLVGDLAVWLLARGLGVRVLTLALSHEHALVRHRDSLRTEARFALGTPSRTPAHLMRVLHERLSRIELPAPVAAIALASEEVAPLTGHNLGLLPGDEGLLPEAPLIDRLRARLGENAVLRVAPYPEHRPEHAMRSRGVNGPQAAQESRKASALRTETTSPALPRAPRPLWLLREPQPLAALLEAQPWVLREGPERIESGWWDGRDVRRDYYVAESPRGEVAWIYRDHRYGTDDGEWFLHGLFA